jgi:soluble lytic murein transglycosylase-like protein
MRFPQFFKPGDQLTAENMNRLALLTVVFAVLVAGMLVWSGILSYYLKDAHVLIEQYKADSAQAEVDLQQRLNDLDAAHHASLAGLDGQLQEAKHELEVLQSKVEIVDEAINGRDKRKARIKMIVAAIKDTVPSYRNHIEGCSKAPSPGELWSIAGAIVDNSEEYAVPASLITAVIKQESAFCNNAVSPVGAKGYMQLMPETAADVSADVAVKTGRALRTWRGRDNIQLGTAYLSAMLLEFDGDIKLAAAAYNAGPTHVKKVLAGTVQTHECQNGMITSYYCETADYIEKVVLYKQEYEKLGLN